MFELVHLRTEERRKKLSKRRSKLAVRLVEIGPRMQMTLYKIEQGIAEGEVLYHSVYTKTAEEVDDLIQHHKKRKKRPTHKFTEQRPNHYENNQSGRHVLPIKPYNFRRSIKFEIHCPNL